MPRKKRKKTNQKIKTLATKSVTAKQASGVKGGGTKSVNRASKKLFEACTTGEHIKKVIIEM